MTTTFRKIVLIAAIAAIITVANIAWIAGWLQEVGAVGAAHTIRHEFLTGTAITILIALFVLLTGRGQAQSAPRLFGRCHVCGHRTIEGGEYCAHCGSRR